MRYLWNKEMMFLQWSKTAENANTNNNHSQI
jgi:hypothetical protein